VKRIAALEGAGLWAASYDETPNPLLALEMRVIGPRLTELDPRSLLDIACGTGRWMAWAAARGVAAIGVDASREMLQKASAKPGLKGRCALGRMESLPFRAGASDLALCSFALAYVADVEIAFHESARVSRLVLLTDLHPAAEAAGWTRSFRAAGEAYEIEHFPHSEGALDEAAWTAGLTKRWRMEAHLDEPERPLFAAAGKASAFESARQTPAILATLWERA
jgi:SAM-dependent methyltransferase